MSWVKRYCCRPIKTLNPETETSNYVNKVSRNDADIQLNCASRSRGSGTFLGGCYQEAYKLQGLGFRSYALGVFGFRAQELMKIRKPTLSSSERCDYIIGLHVVRTANHIPFLAKTIL